jgi:hypothetical protein
MAYHKCGILFLAAWMGGLSPASALECPLPQTTTQRGALKESPRIITEQAQTLAAQGSAAIPSLIHALHKRFPHSTNAEITDYLITAYCPVLNRKRALSDSQRKSRLEQFGDQVRSSLQ